LKKSWLLITGRTTRQADGLHQGRDSQAYREATELVEMNRDEMALLGVQEGQRVAIRTATGRVEVPAQAGDLPPGMLFMPLGPTANVLIGVETDGSGMPGFKGVAAEIEVT
jgi:formylmethanofuran dehydrogenase subunit D